MRLPGGCYRHAPGDLEVHGDGVCDLEIISFTALLEHSESEHTMDCDAVCNAIKQYGTQTSLWLMRSSGMMGSDETCFST